MSFEGYYELLCEKGHYWTVDAYVHELDTGCCPECDGRVAWEHLIDCTNGEDLNLPRIKPRWCTCEACGNQHADQKATYGFPTSFGRLIQEHKE